MGSVVPILNRSNKFTCAICGDTSQGGVSRFDGGLRVGYLCHVCAENSAYYILWPWKPRDPLPPANLRINAWPVLALCLTGIGTVAVVLILSGLTWSVWRTIILLLSPHA